MIEDAKFCRALLVLDLKTEKVIARYHFGDAAGKFEYLEFHTGLITRNNWKLKVVGCSIRKAEEARSFSVLVAAIKKDRVMMTGFTLEDEDLKECEKLRCVTGIEKGALAYFYNPSSGTWIAKKIILHKRAVKSANIKKLKV